MNHFEIEASVIRAKNGNKEELLKLMEQYKPFIFRNARMYNINGFDMYDLVQLGYVAVINAVAKYRVGSNTFGTYVYNAIKNQFRLTYRDNSKLNTELSLNTPLGGENEAKAEFIDLIDSPENLEEDLVKAEELGRVKKAVSKLPSDEMDLIIMVYYNGASMKTYAEKKGLDYSKAMRKRDRILKKLKNIIIKNAEV